LAADNDYLLDSTNDQGEVPLHVAAQHNHLAVAEYLLEAEVDVNEATTSASVHEGYTALHFCAHNNLLEMATLLLEQDGALLFNHPQQPSLA